MPTLDRKDIVFKAIADGTRRDIIDLVTRAQTPPTISDLSDAFDMSRQAVTRHINVLDRAGLLRSVWDGRERKCVPNLQQLKVVADWVSLYQQYWSGRLKKLESFLDDSASHADNRKT